VRGVGRVWWRRRLPRRWRRRNSAARWLGRKIEIVAANHLNKADLAANIARDMLDNQGVEMIFDVALRTAPGRARAGIGLDFQRARARAGKEYFSRRCCRKVSAERSRIEFTTLTLLLESDSSRLMGGLYP
jgi:hypothetical protein